MAPTKQSSIAKKFHASHMLSMLWLIAIFIPVAAVGSNILLVNGGLPTMSFVLAHGKDTPQIGLHVCLSAVKKFMS